MDYMPEYYSSNVNQPPFSQIKKQQKAAEQQRRKQQLNQMNQPPQNIFYILKDEHITNLDSLSSLSSQLSARSIIAGNSLRVNNFTSPFMDNSNNNNNNKKVLNNKVQSRSTLLLLNNNNINNNGTANDENNFKYAAAGAGAAASDEDEMYLIKQDRIRNDLLALLTLQPQKFATFNLPDTFNCTNKHRGLHRDPFDCTKYYYCEDNNNNMNNSSQQQQQQSNNNNNMNINVMKRKDNNNNQIQTKAYICPDNSIFNMKGCYCDREISKSLNCNYLADTYCDFGLLRKTPKKFA